MGFIEEIYEARLIEIERRISVITQELTSLNKEKEEIICKFRNNRNYKILKAKRKHQAALLLPSESPGICVLCHTNINDAYNFGEKFCIGDLIFHNLCATLSPNLKRRGENGLPRLVHQDLVNLLKQSSRVTCGFCQGSGASINCHTCNMAYHLPCGLFGDCLFVASSNVSYCASHRPHTKHNTEINARLSSEQSALPSSSRQTPSNTTSTKLGEHTVSFNTTQATAALAEDIALFPDPFNPASPKTKGRIAPNRNVGSSENSLKVSETLDGSVELSITQEEAVVVRTSPFQEAVAAVQTSVVAEEELSGSVEDSAPNPDDEFGALAVPQVRAEPAHWANYVADTQNEEAGSKAKESLSLFGGNIVSALIGSPSSEVELTPLPGIETVCTDSPLVSKQTASGAIKLLDQNYLEELPSVENTFKCNYVGCTTSFLCKSDLAAHRRTHSGSDSQEEQHEYHCTVCDLTFKRECSFTSHLRTHQAANGIIEGGSASSNSDIDFSDSDPDSSDPESDTSDLESDNSDVKSNSFWCDIQGKHAGCNSNKKLGDKCDNKECKMAFKSRYFKRKHKLSHTGLKSYKCDYMGCECAFSTKSCLKIHQLTHTGVRPKRPYKCDYISCDRAYRSKFDLKMHKLAHTGVKPYKCDYIGCDRAYTVKSTLKSHKLKHRGVKPYKCDYIGCDRAYTVKSTLKSHKLTHNVKPYQCSYCNKSFHFKNPLQRHKAIHEGMKRYKCYYKGCGIVFKSSSIAELKAHQKTHTGEKPFKCNHPGCSATFTAPHLRSMHVLTHDPKRLKTCDFEGCKASFSTHFNLENHKRLHTGEKPFKCGHDGCKLSFRMFAPLQLHIRTHTGEKPFKCTFDGCNSAFRGQNSILRHARTHTGIKPYKCDQVGCNLTFSQGCSLKRHMVTHTGEKPYKCGYVGCNAEFAQSYPLTQHRRSHTAQ